MNPVSTDGYEKHPLLNRAVRDVASRGEGVLTAVTHELHHDGRVVRVAHIRPASGVEWSTAADNVQPADSHHSARKERSAVPGTTRLATVPRSVITNRPSWDNWKNK
ncbi:hypothetical protein [Streptomyces somaliensis]|uniref:hypothetical protein n=1 Tax=Streptomyces somaliensis TaxID=78355 RepID=UPI0034E970EC|nr:hypothetical protein [Streptomyces somaliensis]